MKQRFDFLKIVLVLTVIFVGVSDAAAQRRKPRPVPTPPPIPVVEFARSKIDFTVSMSKPWTHLLEVEMRVKNPTLTGQTELVLPVWTPGSYLIREYARHVQDFAVKDAAGNDLTWEKISKNTWRVNNAANKEFVASYKVYSNELTVRTNDLNDQHAFWTNAALLMHPRGEIGSPSTLKIVPYENWKIAVALDSVGEANVFRAENFDILYDSPVEVGNFKEIDFEALGKPHKIVVQGEGNYNMEFLRRDFKAIVETAAAMFNNELPYKRYLFIVNARNVGRNGLEHLSSTAVQNQRFGFTGANYTNFLTLIAHEYYHLWNVKRIKPDVLGPFDYEKENYTKNLWIAEGTTSYYESVIVRRAKLLSADAYLSDRAAQIADLQRRPGRFQTSLEEASFDAWIKYYRGDENTINREISYYDKGEIVSMLLDLEIRKLTNGVKSLDDVMRYLYAEFGLKNKNYTPADFQKASEIVAGASLEEFFKNNVRGKKELDYNSFFVPFGLQLNSAIENAPTLAFLGADLRQSGEFMIVAAVPAGLPAYEQGLNFNDQIVAVDGFRVATQAELAARLAERKPGDKIRVTFFRFDELRNMEITLGGRAPEQYRFNVAPNLTDAQKQLVQNWLN